MNKEKTDPKIFIGCYVKRFYTPFKEKNMWSILDARGDCMSGDFQYSDGTWRDIEDSTVITDNPEITIDEEIDGEFPWIAHTSNEQYKGYNPFTKEIVGDIEEEVEEVEEIEKLSIELDLDEARKLLNCLVQPDPKGTNLDFGLEIEDKLADYIKENG